MNECMGENERMNECENGKNEWKMITSWIFSLLARFLFGLDNVSGCLDFFPPFRTIEFLTSWFLIDKLHIKIFSF
jgi:hypothetical protein